MINRLLLLGCVCITFSCRNTKKQSEPVDSGLLIPQPAIVREPTGADESAQSIEDIMLPLVSLGENYEILAIYNGNLDLEPSDEQVLLTRMLDDEQKPLSLMIAAANASQNKYDIIWQEDLNTDALTGINLRVDDLSGNNRNDIVIVGFDTMDRHITEIFAVPKSGEITEFINVFSMNIDGNIDIITIDRSTGYFSGIEEGTPYPIVVQQHDLASGNELDLIETRWEWDPHRFTYVDVDSKLVKSHATLEDRISKLYAGNVDDFENYLRGSWYRESGESAYEDMLFFNPDTREIMFYNGTILEIFDWEKSHRTTAKRLYFKISNWVIPSLDDIVYISVNSWENIELARSSGEWKSSYRRLNVSLQNALRNQQILPSLLSDQPISGVWLGHENEKLIFDLPRAEWIEDGKSRSGTASFFDLGDTMVLQIQFLNADGYPDETMNWIAEYSKDTDDTRIIHLLTLTPAKLDTGGARSTATDSIRFEQIEKIL